jgi:type I restriction enzyme S subunit
MVNMGELFACSRLRNAAMDRVPVGAGESKFLLAPGDLLFARQSLVLEGAGRCSIFLGDPEPVTFESHITRVRLEPHKASALFYFYFFQSHQGRSAIGSIVEQGAGASGIRGSDLAKLNVRWPPLDQQRRIAHILSTLDDKIELNRRMSETLEAMARALFKSWFVDFDPVRAKTEGRDTGLPKHLGHLFPDSFEESELGEIPKGWEVKQIADLATIVGGSTPSTTVSEYWAGGSHAWATPKDLSGKRTFVLLETERLITDAGLAQIASGLLPAGTVILSSRAPIGYLAVAEVPLAINQGFIAMRAKVGVSNLFLLQWACVAHDEIVSRANGSTFLEISKSAFRPIQLVVPDLGVMDAFDSLTRPLYERTVTCERQSRALIETRDTLLPKLISGELRVTTPESLVAGELNATAPGC